MIETYWNRKSIIMTTNKHPPQHTHQRTLATIYKKTGIELARVSRLME